MLVGRYTVVATEADCEKFAKKWPCSNFRDQWGNYIRVLAEFWLAGDMEVVELCVRQGNRIITSDEYIQYPEYSALNALIDDMRDALIIKWSK